MVYGGFIYTEGGLYTYRWSVEGGIVPTDRNMDSGKSETQEIKEKPMVECRPRAHMCSRTIVSSQVTSRRSSRISPAVLISHTDQAQVTEAGLVDQLRFESKWRATMTVVSGRAEYRTSFRRLDTERTDMP